MNNVLKLIQELKQKEFLRVPDPQPEIPLRELKLKSSDGTNLQDTKFGGQPDWIQNDETPKCPECHKKMSLVAQIDSFDIEGYHKVISGNRYMFGDVGRIYTFFPFCDCVTDPVAIFQYH